MTSTTVDDVQRSFGRSVLRFMGERATIETSLFDLPAKMVLGNYCGVHVIPDLVQRITKEVAPAELGRRRRTVGLPLALDLNGFLWIYTFGRLQRYLDAGWPEEDVDLDDQDEATSVVRFWEDVTRAYRDDGMLVPEEDGAEPVIRCLDESTVSELAERALSSGRPTDADSLRKAFAQLKLYIFLVHGEQRDGIFNHGPYPVGNERVLVLKELTDLQNRFMPWVTEERRLSTPRVVAAMVLQDVTCTFDMFGTLYTDPEDYFDHIVGLQLLAGPDLEELSENELVDIGEESQRIQRDVFREMAGWDERYKIFHAAYQYANVIYPFLELSGFDDETIRSVLIEPYVEVGERYVDRILDGSAAPVWEHVASGHDPLFPEIER